MRVDLAWCRLSQHTRLRIWQKSPLSSRSRFHFESRRGHLSVLSIPRAYGRDPNGMVCRGVRNVLGSHSSSFGADSVYNRVSLRTRVLLGPAVDSMVATCDCVVITDPEGVSASSQLRDGRFVLDVPTRRNVALWSGIGISCVALLTALIADVGVSSTGLAPPWRSVSAFVAPLGIALYILLATSASRLTVEGRKVTQETRVGLWTRCLR